MCCGCILSVVCAFCCCLTSCCALRSRASLSVGIAIMIFLFSTCFCFFFFSSRRRHTRCLSDWSSDVCSSDLRQGACPARGFGGRFPRRLQASDPPRLAFGGARQDAPGERQAAGGGGGLPAGLRSEERRVGKECRGQRGRGHQDIEIQCGLSTR